MILWVVIAALVVAWVVRYVLARRSLATFARGEAPLTLAIRQKVTPRGTGWRHGYARLSGDMIEWRREHKVGPDPDLSLDRGVVVRDHRPVRKGEAMLSERCEIVNALYKGEEIQFAVLQTELDRLLAWLAR